MKQVKCVKCGYVIIKYEHYVLTINGNMCESCFFRFSGG